MDRVSNPSGAATRHQGWWAYALIWLAISMAYALGMFEFLDRKFQDLRFFANSRPAVGNVVVVEIDAWSLTEFNGWPWPRKHFAAAVENLSAAGATNIVFDVDFSSYSEYENDKQLANALKESNAGIVLPIFQQLTSSAGTSTEVITSRPLIDFEENASLAAINIFPSSDGMAREMNYFNVIDGNIFPMLATKLAEGREEKFYDRTAYSIDYGIDPSTFSRLSMADVIRGRFDPGVVKGKQVLIGATAVALGDQLSVPLYLILPGVYVHALGYESLAQQRALQPLGPIPTFATILLLVVLIAMLSRGLSLLRGHSVGFGFAILIVASSVIVQNRVPVIIDIAPMIAAVVVSYYVTIYLKVHAQTMRLLFQSSDIRRKEKMIHNLVENSTIGIISMDVNGTIETINKSAAAMFGDDRDTFVGANIDSVVRREDISEGKISDYLTYLPVTGTQEVIGHRKEASEFPAEITFSKVDVDDDIVMTAFINDITIRKHQEETLQYRASHDSLTGLLNRDAFSKDLDKFIVDAAENGDEISVFLLDLDRFKEVNDTLGHPTGDLLLRLVAARLRNISTPNAVLARFGGDEFAVILRNVTDVAAVQEFAETVLRQVREPFDLDDISLEVGGSIGAAIFPAHGDTADDLIQRADIAMYAAKQQQTGYSIYSPESDANSVRNLTLTGDLRRAIETGELDIVFQPKVLVSEREVYGVEVLSRWNRPGHGQISPDEFVTHAEQTGLIFPMTEWVLDQALEEASAWRLMGYDLNVAVNLSARLLHHSGVMPLVMSMLKKWDYPPERLILEITENALVANPKEAMAMVERFAALGIRVSIDDFGTGYSSLAYLKTLKVQELKIDKSFVLNLTDDESDRKIVKAVVGLAHDLSLSVVAEGIETMEALAELDQLGCDIGQGYLFGRPMPACDFVDWLKTGEWSTKAQHALSAQTDIRDAS